MRINTQIEGISEEREDAQVSGLSLPAWKSCREMPPRPPQEAESLLMIIMLMILIVTI